MSGSIVDTLIIRASRAEDRRDLRSAIIELQEHERRLHDSRLPGEQVADAYMDWMQRQVAEGAGAILVAEAAGAFCGFVAYRLARADTPAETPDSNLFGHVLDVCVLPRYRRNGVAQRLLQAVEDDLSARGVARLRLSALAANAPARAAYEKAGLVLYEVTYEKRLCATSPTSQGGAAIRPRQGDPSPA
jgi:ribosomal protein S18 acetylase RimI-like enzyme